VFTKSGSQILGARISVRHLDICQAICLTPILVPNICDLLLVGNIITPICKCSTLILVLNICDPLLSGWHHYPTWITNITQQISKCPTLTLVLTICGPLLISGIITPLESIILPDKYPNVHILVPNICDPPLVGDIITPLESPTLPHKCPNVQYWF
jgi:hypothetical protein